ncbi:MAG: glycosyltransferase family 2 protein [Phycisphaerae bacterium]|nr:glycosyltransferase family 2 protein [Gemmatimonadaceae bacterium]
MVQATHEDSPNLTGPIEPPRPLVSVVVPAFNAGQYLGEAIESMLAQSIQNIEIIVVDDGSTDDTSAIAQRYADLDKRVRVHTRAWQSGKPACPRNDGIRLARGEMIALLDADDLATPTRLEEEVNAMRKSGAGLAFADFHKFEGEVPERGSMKGQLQSSYFVAHAAVHLQRVDEDVFLCRPDFIEFMLSQSIVVNVQTVMFRRDLMSGNEAWFDESFTGGEDIDLFYRLAARTPFVYVNKVHAAMRIHEKSLTAVHTMKCMLDAAEVRRINLDRLTPRLDDFQQLRARETLARLYFDIGYMQWVNGLRSAARMAFTSSWQVKPSIRTMVSYAKSFVPRPSALWFNFESPAK